MDKALDIKNLKVAFASQRGIVRAVEGIDISIDKGECLALVGESGCGKSVTGLSILKLLDPSTALIRCDRHILCGIDVSEYGEKQMERIRGKKASMIFQDALSALDPVMTVGKQIDEMLTSHFKLKKKEAKEKTVKALAAVGIPDPEARYRSYPHELSGGMRQRVMIAMAFACEPELIIADEPTTALDVTIQAQILNLLKEMQKKHNTALLLISHDLSVVSHMADRIAVMYSGKIVESARTRELINHPAHPYTRGLMSAVVRIDDSREKFTQIPGRLPDPANKPDGCYFHPRCGIVFGLCKTRMPLLKETAPEHFVRCFCGEEGYDG